MKHITQAVILAGGQGTRLYPLTLNTPKPMIIINGKPFLEYIVELLKKNGITRILLLTGYLHEQIEAYFQDGSKFGLAISYSYSSVKDGTGTRMRKAKKSIDTTFLLLYADNYWPLPLDLLYEQYKKKKKDGLVTVYTNVDRYTKNNIFVADNDFVTMYDKKNMHTNFNGVDIGFFILKKSVLDLLPGKNCSFEEVMLPKLIKKKQLIAYRSEHKYYGLSNLERIPLIEKYFSTQKVVFLDRDGVINKKAPQAHYITRWCDFKFLPGSKKALQLLQKKGYTIFVVTNQPGVARSMFTQKQLDSLHKNLLKVTKKMGVTIKEIFVCTHGWDEGCFCRKPNPGMFFTAAAKYSFNLYDSYCIGDDERDIIAGQRAGCKTFRVDSQINLYTIVKNNL